MLFYLVLRSELNCNLFISDFELRRSYIDCSRYTDYYSLKVLWLLKFLYHKFQQNGAFVLSHLIDCLCVSYSSYSKQ